MSIFEAIILGLIQGLTEFIPVSSSGHLVIFHHVLNVPTQGLAFDVALHAGTLIALIIYFWKDLVLYARALVIKSEKTRLTWLLIYATIPAAILGYLLEGAAETTFRSVKLVSINLLVIGFFMLLAERVYKKSKKHASLENISTRQAMTMGLAQAIAIVPGVSRSGSTITAGLFMGLERVAATRFSFLLGIPITFGAVLKVACSGGTMSEISSQQSIFLVGIITAFISGIFAIKFMLKYLSRHGLEIFAYYRIALGIIALITVSI